MRAVDTAPTFPCADLPNVPHFSVDEVWVWDYDETWGRNNAAMSTLEPLVEARGVNLADMRADRQQTEAEGRPFNAWEYLEDQLSPRQLDRLAEDWAGQPGPNLLYEDAEPVLTAIDEREPQLVQTLLTYTTRPQAQQAKLCRSGIGVRGGIFAEIVTTKDKGPYMTDRWLSGTDTFDFTGVSKEGEVTGLYHAEGLVMVDDKEVSLMDLHPRVRGIYVDRKRRGESRLPGVTTIPDLGGISLIQTVERADCGARRVQYDTPRTAGYMPYPHRSVHSGLIVGNRFTPASRFMLLAA